jgi:predicted ATPase/DNA-binding XRE family transcriptional regulator
MTSDPASPGSAAFAALLREARRSAGYTQAELAGKAGVGVRTVRDLERGRAARPQRTTVELLAAALGLADEARVRFVETARGSAAGRSGTGDTARPATLALPSAAPLIGRERELATIGDLLLAAPGVVTLAGLAGVGKTSAGIAVLHRIGGHFPGGVAGVAATEESTEADMLAAVATVFGVARAANLAQRLAAPALLMIDGIELTGSAPAVVSRLCREAPELRVLAAGRRPLELPGERVLTLEPLETPPEGEPKDLAEVAAYPAAALFLTRMAEVRREPVPEAEAPAVAALVRRLGGLPLGLELAAARGRVLDAREMLDRYGDRLLDLRGPDDDLGLRAAVAGSYRLLDPDARQALRHLAVFRGRWSVELAEDMLPWIGDPVAVLDRLVGLGLVAVRGSGPFRFRLLNVVREFALEAAREAGELPAALRQHARVIARLAARTAPGLTGGAMMAAINRLDHIASDLWAALAHAADDDPETALRLGAELPRWWRFRGRDVQGRQWLRRLIEDPRTAGADPAVHAAARLGVAQLALEHGEGYAELPAAEAALTAYQALGNIGGELAARHLMCSLWTASGGYDEARRHGEAALALATRTERIRDMAVAQNNLTWHEIRGGDLPAARRRLAATERLAAQCGEVRLRALARANLAEVARIDGRYDEAVVVARTALPLLEELGDPRHRWRVLGTVGMALAQSGRLNEAAEIAAEMATGPADGVRAAVEGWIALRRGARDVAAEWFTAAASTNAGRHDARDLVEALVGLAASSSGTDRAAVLAHLEEVCRQSGIILLPPERALLARTDSVEAAGGRTVEAGSHGAGGAPLPPG